MKNRICSFLFFPPFFSLFLFLAQWQKYIFSTAYYSTQPAVKDRFLSISTSKRSITQPGHCHHNEILSVCQETPKDPNKCVAKLWICGFLGVALAANGLSVRAPVQKTLRFVCCWFFLETCGFVTSLALHWAMLLYCLILSRVEENCFWQQNANIFLRCKSPSGALFFSSLQWMSKLCKVLLYYGNHGYFPNLLTGELCDYKIRVWFSFSRTDLAVHSMWFMASIKRPCFWVFCCFFLKRDFAPSCVLDCDRACKNNKAVHSLSVSLHVMFSFVLLVIMSCQCEWC